VIKLNLKDIAQAVGGKIYNANENLEIDAVDVSINTREDLRGKIFIPIIGANFDGHDFIIDAFNGGAILAFSQKIVDTDKPYIFVNSTFEAIGAFAKYYRSLFDIPVIGITGSVGKTTTKDLTAAILSAKYNVLKTQGNFNNEIGLPLTVFKLDKTVEVVVLEMGMNHFGEIHKLADIARPNICIITNIGEAHIENLGSRDGILKAKSEIFDFADASTKIILNGDNDKLITLKDKFPQAHFYYLDDRTKNFTAYDVEVDGLSSTTATIKINSDIFKVNIGIAGEYMVRNAIVGSMVARFLGLSNEEIQLGTKSFKPSQNRMDVIKSRGMSIINDVYNSSPLSVKNMLALLENQQGRKVAILGDMFELGEFAEDMHSDVGKYASEKNIDVLICIGSLSINTYNSAEGINKFYFKDKEEFLNNIDILQKGDIVLVKASRGMQFETIIMAITKEE